MAFTKAQIRDELLKRRGYLDDLYAFNLEVIGQKNLVDIPHKLMCDSVAFSEHNNMLHLWPRGHLKSSLITVGDSIRRLCKNPNVRILIANEKRENAVSFLREIKGHLENNETIAKYYGNHVSRDAKWTEDAIISAKRTENKKEPSIQAAGVGQSLTGQHYDVIYLDDLISQDTIGTKEQIQKSIDWYKFAYSLLDPGGVVIIVGTRYHDRDLYGYIIKNEAEDFDIQTHTVYREDGSPLWPERFTPEIIEGIKKKQGSYIFACQYLNNPVDDETAKFKISNFLYYHEPDLVGKRLRTTMTIDRAYSLAKTADFTGIVIRSIDDQGNWYVRYAKRHKESEGELINNIFALKNLFKVDKVGVEQKAFTYTLEPSLRAEMRRRGDFFSVVELKAHGSKEQRIESLVPMFESHSVFFLHNECNDLEDELLRFPRAEHDDLADALAYHNAEDMRHMPTNKPNRNVRPPRFDEITGRRID